jgi:hypothetical protein
MGTNRAFKVILTNSGKVVEKRDYESTPEEYLNTLNKRVVAGSILICCGCSDQMEMKISKTLPPYLYPSSKKHKHTSNCVRNPSYQGDSEYERAWSYDETSNQYIVKIDELAPTIPTKIELQQAQKGSRVYHIYDGKEKGTVTIYGLATKLNMMAWSKIVEGKERLPENRAEVQRYAFGATKNIRLSNKEFPLQAMFYDQFIKEKGRISNFEVKTDITFVYMYYMPSKRGETDQIGKQTLNVVYGENAFGKEIGFYVEDIVDFEMKKSLEPHSEQYILAGFAYRASTYHHRMLTLGNYCLIPVSEFGLFVESSHEKRLFDQLCIKDKIRFVKPYLPIEGYGNFIPDFIMFEEGKKPIVGEIFGMHKDKEYEKRKREKIALSKTEAFKSIYRFWQTEF